MLLPRYSLRTILLALTPCAFFFIAIGEAIRGRVWAVVVSVAVVSLVVLLLFHAFLFLIAAAMTRLLDAQHKPAHTSRGGLQSTPDHQTPGQLLSDQQATPLAASDALPQDPMV